jgi:hypothetical protein
VYGNFVAQPVCNIDVLGNRAKEKVGALQLLHPSGLINVDAWTREEIDDAAFHGDWLFVLLWS